MWQIHYEGRGFVYVRVPALREATNLKLFQTLVGFVHEARARKLSDLIRIYEGKPLAERALLKDKVVAMLIDAPKDHFELMKAFNLKRGAVRRLVHSLIREKRILTKKVNGKYIYSS